MDNLIKLKDKYDLSNKIVSYYLSEDIKKDIVKDLEKKPYKLIGFGVKEKLIENLLKDESDNNLYKLLKILYKNSSDGNIYCSTKFLRKNSNIKFINIWQCLNILKNEKIVIVKNKSRNADIIQFLNNVLELVSKEETKRLLKQKMQKSLQYFFLRFVCAQNFLAVYFPALSNRRLLRKIKDRLKKHQN